MEVWARNRSSLRPASRSAFNPTALPVWPPIHVVSGLTGRARPVRHPYPIATFQLCGTCDISTWRQQAAFALASAGCLLATDIWTFLGFRMAQCAISAGWAISMAMIRDTEEEGRAASLMGYVSMTMAIAPMLGPMLGGGLAELFGWRACFAAYCGLGAALFIWCLFDLDETSTRRTGSFKAQARAYPALLRSRIFWAFAACMAFSVGSFYAFLAGAPLVAATHFDMAPGALGIWLGSITAGFMAGNFLSGRLAARRPRALMILSGRLTACAGLATGVIVVASGPLSPATAFGFCLFVGVGNGLTSPSASAGAMSVRPDLAGSASGLMGAMIVATGALVTSATGAILTLWPSPVLLLGLMLGSAAISLMAALMIRQHDRRKSEAEA